MSWGSPRRSSWSADNAATKDEMGGDAREPRSQQSSHARSSCNRWLVCAVSLLDCLWWDQLCLIVATRKSAELGSSPIARSDYALGEREEPLLGELEGVRRRISAHQVLISRDW